jgi:plastocyanin
VTAGQTAAVNFDLEAVATTTGTIAGTVSAGGAGVANATLTLTGSGVNRVATSGSSGSYAFASVAPGNYSVHIAPPSGYALGTGETADKAATVAAGLTTTVNFAVASLNPVTVIAAQASSFSPADVTVAVGTQVRWTNGSGVPHTVTPDGHSEWVSAGLANSGEFQHVFTTAGTFPYLCEIHLGMTGVVRVQ